MVKGFVGRGGILWCDPFSPKIRPARPAFAHPGPVFKKMIGQCSMQVLPSLDAHAHLAPSHSPAVLAKTGAVLAIPLCLDEAAQGPARSEPNITWGVGCHPRRVQAQESFDPDRFVDVAQRSAMIGEIGLDSGSRAPMDLQLSNFEQVLAIVTAFPRLVSIHSYRATRQVLDALRRTPSAAQVLHCGAGAIPFRVEWVEHLVGQQYGFDMEQVKRLVWRNLASLIETTGTLDLFPESFQTNLVEL